MRTPPPIYLDCAATTAVDPRVAELVTRLFMEEFGNAGSRTHAYGAAALREVNLARERIATAMRASPEEVIFTSGATESDNLAILGLAAWGKDHARRHIVSTQIEHKAVLEPLQRLAQQGYEVTLVPPNAHGHVAAEAVLAAVRPDTLLVSIMHANNETGALQPIEAIANGLDPDGGPFFHVDAAQTFGRDTRALSHARIDLVSASGHKVFAPKGVGCLLMRRRRNQRAPIAPLMVGGGQERGLRPGTLPVPLIAGFGLAAEIAEAEQEERRATCLHIRQEALRAFARLSPVVHGDEARGVLPHLLSIAFPGVDSEAVMIALKEAVAISNGSACTSAKYEPSHVLEAMGLPEDVTRGTVRMSWSHATPAVAWDRLAERLAEFA
ncbi:aminotransferase class V-fold PLP-dependent enzyme [Methylobacterium sp.]|uniref:aminotransferase class V-fold PLP-dependent enzyme n=1 Tax=Methylobacterium sp. TaxID=409 RepID=UPI000C3F6887|nr:aminotransferase class V-fold PLP-dependent enzyme [Methylobacterium sp.]MBP33151.1 cysteine desulfurase DndA [Methylobacterium sp.]